MQSAGDFSVFRTPVVNAVSGCEVRTILETGWFKSSVCRNKNNLFGLTNPQTKTYYKFDHWIESVAAYYSKVQYRYKGGNYLL